MATKEQVQKLIDKTSQLVLREDGLPKQPGDHVDAVSRRLAKRVLELEEACAYLLVVRNDTIDVLRKLSLEAQTLATQIKNLGLDVGMRHPGITLEELRGEANGGDTGEA